MSSSDQSAATEARLLERLLTDHAFRAAFRRSPAEACRSYGLYDVADELSAGSSMETMEVRESKSSLAGAVMALAAEVVGVGELAGVLSHGHEQTVAGALGHRAALELPGGKPGAGGPSTEPVAHAGSAPSGTSVPSGTSAAMGEVSAEAAGGSGASSVVAELLANPRLSVTPQMRNELVQEDVDPRVITVLRDTLTDHTVVIGDFRVVSQPTHAQVVTIVSVDGQPVGPTNIGARDLLTEIVALDPSVRPTEIASPWRLQGPGLVSDPGHPAQLRLSFVSASDPRAHGTQVPGPRDPAGQPPLSSVAPASPAASTPGSGVDAALTYARAMIGKLPESAGSNLGPQLDRFEADFGFHGAPWCGIFAGHVLEAAGLKVHHTVASVASILDLARNGDPPFLKGVLPVSEARPGDLVTFGGAEHVAVVTKVDAAGIHTIAGNTSQSNVSATTYSPSSVTGVVRPDYAAGKPGSIAGVWQESGEAPPTGRPPGAGPASRDDVDPTAAASQQTADAQTTPASQPPVKPLTAVFAAPPHRTRRAFQRQTVEFRALSAAPPGAPPRHLAPDSPPHIAATAAEVSGGAISVSSPLLTSGQAQFAARLAQLTGLDPRVISAWELAEESGGAARSYQGRGYFNWLNIGQFDSGPGQIAFDAAFKDPITAAEQTAKFLEGKWGGASPGIRAILATASRSPQQQIDAIA